MNVTFQDSIYFDANGSNSDTFTANHSIALEIAKYDYFSSNRRVRRERQSLAVRDLLNSSLQKLFPEKHYDSWVLNKTLSGKPFLSAKDSPSISISHSGDWCACSVAASFIIGVDVEVIKPRDWEVYCRDVFHPEEARWVLDVCGYERDVRGLICWCRKESIVKALGQGLSVSLAEIGFSSEGNLIALPKEFGETSGWGFYSKVIREEVVVAVAWKI